MNPSQKSSLQEVLDMTPQAMRLKFGELTAGEIRTIRAVLRYIGKGSDLVSGLITKCDQRPNPAT